MQFDLVVGIPSYNEADSISFVTTQVDLGIQKYFPDKKSIIINVDNHSPDNTKQAFLETKTVTAKKYISTPKGKRGKGRNLYNLFKFVAKSKAKIGIVVDADLKSINPLWIKHFTEPILQGYDLVCPWYDRCTYDATLTNNICYPFVYGLLGKDIRQPIGGDFAFSKKLSQYWLNQEWKEPIKNFGVDIFMTTYAILGDFQICRVDPGTKIHKPSESKLGPMFLHVVEVLFQSLIDSREKWINVKAVEKPKIFGRKKFDQLQKLTVNAQEIKKEALKTYNKKMIENCLSKENFLIVDKLFSEKQFNINSKLWAEVTYDFLVAFAKAKGKNKKAVIEAMRSLYFARVLSFIQKTKNWSQIKAEEEVQKQARVFWRKRNYLVDRLKILTNLSR